MPSSFQLHESMLSLRIHLWQKSVSFRADGSGQPGSDSLVLLPSKMNHLKEILLLAFICVSVSADDLFFLFTNGLRRVYYEQLTHLPVDLSKPCEETLIKLYKHITLGHNWAHRFIDSSAASPVSIFTGTVTDLGSFDSCITNDEPSQYCLIESVPSYSLPYSMASIKLRNSIPSLAFFNVTSGICMPKSCNINDIKNLWSSWLPKYSMNLVNSHKIACSGENNFENSSWYALYALIFIIIIQILIGIIGQIFPSNSSFRKIFSPFVHLKQLFHTDDRNATVVDGLKVFMILMGISAHCLLCIEKLVAIALLSEYEMK